MQASPPLPLLPLALPLFPFPASTWWPTSPTSTTRDPTLISVFVGSMGGTTMVFEVKTSGTVNDLKSVVMDRDGVAADNQRMIFGGKELAKPEEKLAHTINIPAEGNTTYVTTPTVTYS
jgi:hypothetical protein